MAKKSHVYTETPFAKFKPIKAKHKLKSPMKQKSVDYGKYSNAYIAYRKYVKNRDLQKPGGPIAPFKKFKNIWFGKKPSEAIGGINK